MDREFSHDRYLKEIPCQCIPFWIFQVLLSNCKNNNSRYQTLIGMFVDSLDSFKSLVLLFQILEFLNSYFW